MGRGYSFFHQSKVLVLIHVLIYIFYKPNRGSALHRSVSSKVLILFLEDHCNYCHNVIIYTSE